MKEMQEKTHHNKIQAGIFGFWLYLMTDLLMFAVLFAAYIVLKNNTNGGITIYNLFNPPYILTETLILLTSSFTCGIGLLWAEKKEKNKALFLFCITFLLGLSFLAMELLEFSHLFSEGDTFQKSAFLSSYFSLIGTHGLHIFIGLLWLGILIIHVLVRGITENNINKLKLVSMFWHFLDIVWIFIFTIVYLFGGVL